MNAKKFTFDVEFRPDGDLISNAARARQRKSYTQEEIDIMCAKYRAEGAKAGQVRAADAVATGAEQAAQAIREALASAHDLIDAVRGEAADLAFALAKKMARAALAALPAQEVELALREALHQAIGEPRIVLRAAPKVAEALEPRAAEIAHEEGFEGRVQVTADATLTNADCRIEWRGGGAERSEAAIETALEKLITRRFAAQGQRPLTEDIANGG
jgi:flagellar assembly protein FliH